MFFVLTCTTEMSLGNKWGLRKRRCTSKASGPIFCFSELCKRRPLQHWGSNVKEKLGAWVHWDPGSFSGQIQTVSYLWNSSGYSWTLFVGWKQAWPAQRSVSLRFRGQPLPQKNKIPQRALVFNTRTQGHLLFGTQAIVYLCFVLFFSMKGCCYYWARCHGLEKAVWLKLLSWQVMNGAAGQH